MANCWSAVNICALRVTQLLATGQPDYGADGFATHVPVSLGVSPSVTEGQLLEQTDGCGNICASYQQPDRTASYGLALNVCKRDYGLWAMMTGGTEIGDGVGFMLPDPESTILPTLVETWQIAQDGSAVTGQYIHTVYPWVTWSPGDSTKELGVEVVTFNGKVSPNPIGFDSSGPYNDWPNKGAGPMWEFYDDELPAIVCGYQALAS